jgi:hypothetical protein
MPCVRSRSVPLALLSLLALTVLVAAGCGDEAHPHDGPEELTVTCALEVAPAVVGRNALIVAVTRDGVAVTDAVLTVDPQMPTMGHGSTETPVVTHEGGGIYRAYPVTLQMPGYWEVTVHATAGDDHGTDVVELNVSGS